MKGMYIYNKAPFRTFSVLLLFFLILSGCAIFRTVDHDKEQLLLSHLQIWEEFQMDGVAELAYRQLRFRKNITIQKRYDDFRLTIYDGGIFGLRPKPFVSVRIDKSLSFEGPDALQKMLEEENVSIEGITIDDLNQGITELLKNRAKIIRNSYLKIGGTDILFNDRMQIREIIIAGDGNEEESEGRSQKEPLIVTVAYGRDDNPSRMEFLHKGNLVLGINIDRMRSGHFQSNAR